MQISLLDHVGKVSCVWKFKKKTYKTAKFNILSEEPTVCDSSVSVGIEQLKGGLVEGIRCTQQTFESLKFGK